jgi:hypothetical protein
MPAAGQPAFRRFCAKLGPAAARSRRLRWNQPSHRAFSASGSQASRRALWLPPARQYDRNGQQPYGSRSPSAWRQGPAFPRARSRTVRLVAGRYRSWQQGSTRGSSAINSIVTNFAPTARWNRDIARLCQAQALRPSGTTTPLISPDAGIQTSPRCGRSIDKGRVPRPLGRAGGIRSA